MEYNKIPPQDIEAEKSLLCCIMIDKYWHDKLEDNEIEIKPEYFYNNNHSILYNIIENIYDKNINVDLITLREGIKRTNGICNIEPSYLAELLNQVSTSAAIVDYAKIIKEKFVKRTLICLSSEIIENSYDESKKSKHIINDIESNLLNIVTNKDKNRYTHIDKVLMNIFKELEERCSSEKKIIGYTTGFSNFDYHSGGFTEGQLIVFAGRPGQFKTGFALKIAERLSVHGAVAIPTLEMTNTQLVYRMLACKSQVLTEKLKNGTLDVEDWRKLQKGIGELSEKDIYINDCGQSLQSLVRGIKRLKRQNPNLKFVFYDYIGLTEISKNLSRHEGIGEISTTLKRLAKDLGLVIFILSQLNREVEKRPDKRPMLSDLRDSGSIEQDVDMGIFFYNPGKYQITNCGDYTYPDNYLGVIFDKNREGKTGEIPFIAKPEVMDFNELDNSYSDFE